MSKLLEDERMRHINELKSIAANIRGNFLDVAIWIEKLIEDIIASHFCTDSENRALFFSLIMNSPEFTFYRKIGIFDELLKICYPDLYKLHSDLLKKLDKIRKFRNRLAHATLDITDNFLSKNAIDRVQIRYYEKGREKQQVITLDEKDHRLSECWEVVMQMFHIKWEISVRANRASTANQNSKHG